MKTRKMIRNYCLLLICLLPFAGRSQVKWPNGKKAAVVLTFDDGIKSHLQIVVPHLEARNMRGTFFLYGQVVSKADVNEWRDISRRGHELGNHSVYHPCLSGTVDKSSSMCRSLECYTVEMMLEEISIMNSFLYAIDGKGNYAYAYPCGHHVAGGEDYSESLIRSGLVKYARGGAGGIVTDTQTLDISKVPVLSIPEGYKADQLIKLAKEVLEKNALGIFVFHGVGGDYLTVDEQEFILFLDYLNDHSNEIWTTTFSQAMDWLPGE